MISGDELTHEEQMFSAEVSTVTKCDTTQTVAFRRRCRALFGCSIRVLAFVFLRLKALNNGIEVGKRIHLLMALHFLKAYAVEEDAATLFGVSEKTFRQHARRIVVALSELGMIEFAYRFENWSAVEPSCTIDGSHFLVREGPSADPVFYSHKTHHAGVTYNVALSLGPNPRIVYVGGGVPAGAWSDLRLARDDFVPRLAHGERALADAGYKDGRYFMYPYEHPYTDEEREFNRLNKRFMARHECINSRFKVFACLRGMFRHDIAYHRICMFAIANIINCNLIERPRSFPPMPH